MDFIEKFSNIQDKRIEMFNEIKQQFDIPLILYGGGPNSVTAKNILENNGVKIALHCTDAEYISKRPDLFPIENVVHKFPKFNIFIGILDYISVLDKLKNISGVNKIYYCDLNEYIVSRSPFTKEFLSQNADKFSNVYDILNDKISKDSFLDFIKTRITGDFSYIVEKYDKNIKPYFDFDIINLKPKEFFIDCGAYTGDTIRDLIEVSNNKEHKIYAFEPETSNLIKLNEYVKQQELENVNIIPKGCWSCKDTLSFNICGDKSSINADGIDSIEVDGIDNLLLNQPISFIKMDIEGAEYEALLGAKNVIEKNKPKLAISLYHRNEDLFKLPELIHEICSEYKFFVRFHSCATHEFVLYAMVD